ncbi:MAG: DNA polymerase III subunit [Deltaproteobacteria bacterium]|jgi:DNA polymerase III delta' subunit|nr:DNA polymerase III subunit [Deltaproteobacteria bacterium]
MPWTLTGAELPKKTLSAMMARGRLPHALLFTGPAGGGKFTMALDLAKAVNCLSPFPDGSPCGICVSCAKTRNLTHPDLSLVFPKGKAARIPIDDIRNLREYLAFKPYEGKTKVAIVRGAERFSEESGGALLKTLEEPTPDTLLVLTANSAGNVMTTLVSRCLSMRIPPLSREEILKALKYEKDLEGDKAELAAGLSGGALGAALGMDEDMAWFVWTRIENVFKKQRGLPRLTAAMKLSAAFAEELEKLKAVKDDPDYVRANEFLDLFCASLRLWFRDAAVIASLGPKNFAPDGGENDLRRFIEGPAPSEVQIRFSRSVSPKRLNDWDKAVSRLSDSVSRYINADLVFRNFWLSVLD